jgi:peptide/nickel transport system permease protein
VTNVALTPPTAAVGARPRAGRASLVTGAILCTLLTGLSVAAWFVPEEVSRVGVRHEPPHPAWLRTVMWHNPAHDSIVRFMGDATATEEEGVFDAPPLPIARVGRRYEYRPAPSIPLAEFTLRGQPDGLAVDPVTGVVSGIPAKPGSYELALEARLDDDRSVVLRFPLFVDDRFLLLGADERGRDLARRLLNATRYTIVPGLIAVLVGVGGGVLVGAVSGFRGGPTRRALRGLTSMLQSIPGLLVVFIAAVLSNFQLHVVMATVGLILLPETANGVSERVASFRRSDFVEAARELGLRDRTILWNEIIWQNCRSYVLSRCTQAFVFAILMEITLTYMGLTQHSTSLGYMLVQGRNAWVADTSSVQGVVTLISVLLFVAAFGLLERGIRLRWEGPR